MATFPVKLVQAAQRLLENTDMKEVFEVRLYEAEQDVLYASEETLHAAHKEYNTLKEFGEWIKHVSETRINKKE